MNDSLLEEFFLRIINDKVEQEIMKLLLMSLDNKDIVDTLLQDPEIREILNQNSEVTHD